MLLFKIHKDETVLAHKAFVVVDSFSGSHENPLLLVNNGYTIIDGYVDHFDLSKTPLKLNISLNFIVDLYTIHKITVTVFTFLFLDFRSIH